MPAGAKRSIEHAFAAFIERHDKPLREIARFSKGEATVDDVRNEAYVQAFELAVQRGSDFGFDIEADATQLLQHLRRHFDRAGRRARMTRHLEQPLGSEPDSCTLADLVPADEGDHPRSLLEAMEEPAPPERPDPYHSETAAWRWLVERFDRRMSDIAAFLLISTSWCGVRRRRARHRAQTQWQLPHRMLVGQDDADAIQPWRKFKLPARGAGDEAQLALDYWPRPQQPERGQLWLL